MKLIILLILIVGGTSAAPAQIATGGSYTLNKSVIASGGGTSSDGSGALYTVSGTIGQAAAGATSGGSYVLNGGFQTSTSRTPTAAAVSIGGRVLISKRGLINATVYLTEQTGVTRTTQTTALGYYHFDDIAAGQTVVMTVVSKRYQFTPQVVSVSEELTNLDFYNSW